MVVKIAKNMTTAKKRASMLRKKGLTVVPFKKKGGKVRLSVTR
jgi:hypothetical protein